MAGPCGVLPASPTVATTVAEEDIDGGPLGGCYRRLRQWPPLKLMEMSMAGPLGVAAGRSGSGYHHCWRSHRWWHLAPYRGLNSIFCLNAY
jgi:hypothetical protein